MLIGPKAGKHQKPDGFAGDLQSYLVRTFGATLTLHTTPDRTIFAVTGPLDSDNRNSEVPVGQERVKAVADVLVNMIYNVKDGPDFSSHGSAGRHYF